MYGHYLVKPGVGLGHHVVEPEEVWETMCQGVSDLNLKYFILNAGSASVEISFLLMFFWFYLSLLLRQCNPLTQG